MRWPTTAALAALLALLGGFYYVYEVRLGPGREEANARKGRVFAADTKDVTELTIKRAGETVRLKREGDGWELLEPVRARGNRPAVDETLANVLTAKIDREIDANPKSPADFGLETPAADLTLTLKDGATSRTSSCSARACCATPPAPSRSSATGRSSPSTSRT